MASVHTVARDLLVGAYQNAAVAAAAGIASLTWTGRVLQGDRDGYIGELHRGRLPAVEIIQQPGEAWQEEAYQVGKVRHSWMIRVHVAGFSQVTAEAQARAILYAGLIQVRALNYWKVGGDTVGEFSASALGHQLECVITCESVMERADYETTPESVVVPPTSEGDVGGISTTINYNSASPVAILTIPADQALDTVSVEVITPFDGTLPTLSIGIDGEQGRYMATSENDITEAGSTWEKDANDAGVRTVKVWLGGTGATQGQVKVQLSVTNA